MTTEPDARHHLEVAERVREFRRLPLAVAGAEIVLDQWRRALAHEAGVRAATDPEDVHKMRVALRRLRAAAGVFGKAIDRAAPVPIVDELAADAATVARALGAVRDVDVAIDFLQSEADTAPYDDLAAIQYLVELRQERRTQALSSAISTLDGAQMQRLRATAGIRLAPLIAAGRARGGKPRVKACAPAFVAKRLRRLRRLEPSLVVPAPDDLHRARIAAKKLRYTAEFLSPGYPDVLPATAALATGIQDALGEIHDLDVFESTFLADVDIVAHDTSRSGLAAGIAHVVRRGRERRDAALERFRHDWAALPRPGALRKQIGRSPTSPPADPEGVCDER